MAIHLNGGPAALLALLILIVPAAVIANYSGSLLWPIMWPVGLVGVLILAGLLSPARKVTPQQYAELLEKHLEGTEGAWGWDNTTSIRIADKRLDKLRCKLAKFDTFALPEWEEEFKEIIAALRRGEIPEVRDDS